MAVQYWAQRQAGKTQFVGLEEGYHGDTLGAIGAGYVSWFHEPYAALVASPCGRPRPPRATVANPKRRPPRIGRSTR